MLAGETTGKQTMAIELYLYQKWFLATVFNFMHFLVMKED